MQTSGEAPFLRAEIGQDGYYSAIERRSGNDEIVWRYEPIDGSADAVVSATLESSRVVINTWSGWRIVLDAESGTELERAFTK